MISRTLSTPEELVDYLIGKRIYQRGGFINDCANEIQRRGFSNMVSRSLGCSWAVFNEQPQQAIRFSEAAFQNVFLSQSA